MAWQSSSMALMNRVSWSLLDIDFCFFLREQTAVRNIEGCTLVLPLALT